MRIVFIATLSASLTLFATLAAGDAVACVVDPDCVVTVEGDAPECLEVPDRVFCDDLTVYSTCEETLTLRPADCEPPCYLSMYAEPGDVYLDEFSPLEDSPDPGEIFEIELAWELGDQDGGEFTLAFNEEPFDFDSGCETSPYPDDGGDETDAGQDSDVDAAEPEPDSPDGGCATTPAAPAAPLALLVAAIGLIALRKTP